MTVRRGKVDVLFVSEQPTWPLDQGFRIRGSHMIEALSRRGVSTAIASMAPWPVDAPMSLRSRAVGWMDADADDVRTLEQSWRGGGAIIRKRVARYLAPSMEKLAGVVALARRYGPSVVVGLGQHAPMMLSGLANWSHVNTVWYAADDLVRFHLSCLLRDPMLQAADRLTMLGMHALLERSFGGLIDGVVGVSPADTRWLARMTGVSHAVTIRNGVDQTRWSPALELSATRDVVFWGRMDFEPNVEAACWFVERVWSGLRRRFPDAMCHLVGKNVSPRIARLGRRAGVRVHGAVPDIQPIAKAAGVTVLPMRSGGGIKNKLLEAAAMGLPIVASPRAVSGLSFDPKDAPVAIARSPGQWVRRIAELWTSRDSPRRLGWAARQWVEREHTWDGAAGRLVRWLDELMQGRAWRIRQQADRAAEVRARVSAAVDGEMVFAMRTPRRRAMIPYEQTPRQEVA